MDRYYMIHKPNGGSTPSKVHTTPAEAQEEAKRLAQKHPGDLFVVLESALGYQIKVPEPTVFTFN